MKIFAIAIGATLALTPMIAAAQSYDGYRPAAQPVQQMPPHWDSFGGQVPQPANFERVTAAGAVSEGVPLAPVAAAPEYQPQYTPAPQYAPPPPPQPRCGTGQVFIVSPDNTTSHRQVTMCQNEVGQWVVRR